MKEYNIAIIAGIFTIMAALVPIILSKRKKEKLNSKRNNELNLDSSNGNLIQVFNGDINKTKDEYTNQERIKANFSLFELTDGLIKIVTIAFRPLKLGPPKNNIEYLNDVIDKYNEYIIFFDSKEFLFRDEVVEVVKSIKEIIDKAIILQRSIEFNKSQNMPWEIIIPDIDAITELYHNRIQIELPKHRETLKNIIKHN